MLLGIGKTKMATNRSKYNAIISGLRKRVGVSHFSVDNIEIIVSDISDKTGFSHDEVREVVMYVIVYTYDKKDCYINYRKRIK